MDEVLSFGFGIFIGFSIYVISVGKSLLESVKEKIY